MKPTLYQAAQDVQHSIALCVDEDGVIDTDKMDGIECAFKDKAVATVAVFKGCGHRIDTLKAYRAEVDAQIKREERNRERLKDYLHATMLVSGIDKIKSDDGLLNATLYRERDVSVEIDEGAVFPAELCADPKPPLPSKTKIKAAIEAGQPVAGARIVRRDRLVF